MFAIESLALAGETYENSESVRKACAFLMSKQMEDGGWGESYKVRILSIVPDYIMNTNDHITQSCETEIYVHNLKSQVSFYLLSTSTQLY